MVIHRNGKVLESLAADDAFDMLGREPRYREKREDAAGTAEFGWVLLARITDKVTKGVPRCLSSQTTGL